MDLNNYNLVVFEPGGRCAGNILDTKYLEKCRDVDEAAIVIGHRVQLLQKIAIHITTPDIRVTRFRPTGDCLL
jgi:hypothetical protein